MTESPVHKQDIEAEDTVFLWHNFLQTLSLHGFHQVFERGSAKIRRILWLIILIAALVMVCVHSERSIRKYFERPVSTNVHVEFVEEIIFPAVTICNFNLFPFYLINGTVGEKIMSILAPQKHIDRQDDVLFARSPIPNFNQYKRSLLLKDDGNDTVEDIDTDIDVVDSKWDFDQTFNFAEFVKTHGHRIDHMIKKCRWRSEKCGPENFTAVITEFGLCYTFNSGKTSHRVLKVNRAGVDFALRLQLNVQQDQYYGSLRDSAGFKVMVHDQAEPAMINELGFAIQPGTHTFCSLKKIVINNLPKPYRASCEDLKLRGFSKYTKSACLLLCRARFIISRCRCSSYDLRGLETNVPPCLPQQVKNCVWPAMEEFRNETNNCRCPIPCHITKFLTQLSYAQMPAKHFSEVLARKRKVPKDVMRNYLRDNFLDVDIYFEEMSVEEITERPAYDEESLFGDIGGQVGLFLGASILTLLEFIDLLARILSRKCKKKLYPEHTA
ncbi:acid-sensing ion channel 2-like [Dendronephthya gigantea]|uniref:acid-sensing ion channel 2-like n=1 Tax=Dendronephthya gigantea TaxID=151771 RepID=UPI00106CAB13|nr:acid-sensing ion channel 2-like [Dendronephthya gigantea]